MQHNRPRRAASLLAAVIATPVALFGAPVPAQADVTALAAACLSHEISATILEGKATPLVSADCDLRGKTIRAGALGVEVPRSNRGVTIFGTFAQDASVGKLPHSLSVLVEDNLVTIAVDSDLRREPAADRGHEPPANSPKSPEKSVAAGPECSQNAHAWTGNVQGYLDWGFTLGTVPAYFNEELAEADLLSGSLNIDNGYNDCGLATPIGAKDTDYLGGTLTYPNIYSTPACHGQPGGENEVAFGAINTGGILAVTCTWWYNWPGDNPIEEADMVFNRANNLYFYTIPSGCSGRYELQGVATHEFGHAFGLDHVSEDTYRYMTMSPIATPCSYSDSSLGLGDYNGLQAHY